MRQHIPDCPICLAGSVALRHERPDSDIDLLVIVSDVATVDFPGGKIEWEEDQFRLVASGFQDVPLHLHFATCAFLHDFEVHPWRAYKFLKVEVLHDPQRIVQKSKDKIAPWFNRHPNVVQLWRQWLDEHKQRQLSGGNQIGPLLQQFPNQMPEFWNHLDEMCGDEVAEPKDQQLSSEAAPSASPAER